MMRAMLAGIGLFMMLGAAAPMDQPLTMTLNGLRSTKGNILVCLTRSADHFPDCSGDAASRHFTMPATAASLLLGPVAPGDYAIAIIHDENGNGKLDTFAGIPREGVGFSRNPVIRFGAPSFHSSRFSVTDSPVRQDITLKYFL